MNNSIGAVRLRTSIEAITVAGSSRVIAVIMWRRAMTQFDRGNRRNQLIGIFTGNYGVYIILEKK